MKVEPKFILIAGGHVADKLKRTTADMEKVSERLLTTRNEQSLSRE